MKNGWTTAVVTAALTFATSCGPLQSDNRGAAVVADFTSSLTGAEDAAADTPINLNREFIEAQPVNLMQLSLVSRDAVAIMVLGMTNGSKLTWVSPDSISVTFDQGLVVGTRGLGDDLMGADVAGALLSLDGGQHTRTLDFIDGLDQIQRRSFDCSTAQVGQEALEIVEKTYQTTIWQETCSDGQDSFQNTYWRDAAGVIWQSRQWVSTDVGYLGYRRL